jgi:hypothetical protein
MLQADGRLDIFKLRRPPSIRKHERPSALMVGRERHCRRSPRTGGAARTYILQNGTERYDALGFLEEACGRSAIGSDQCRFRTFQQRIVTVYAEGRRNWLGFRIRGTLPPVIFAGRLWLRRAVK